MNKLQPVPFKDEVNEKQRFSFIRASDLEFKEPEFIVNELFETDSLALVFGYPDAVNPFWH